MQYYISHFRCLHNSRQVGHVDYEVQQRPKLRHGSLIVVQIHLDYALSERLLT